VGACGSVYLYKRETDGRKLAMKIENTNVGRNFAQTLSTESHYMRVISKRIKNKDGKLRVPLFEGDTFASGKVCLKIEFLEFSVPEYLTEQKNRRNN
jgi:serine/threonine protein kinase